MGSVLVLYLNVPRVCKLDDWFPESSETDHPGSTPGFEDDCTRTQLVECLSLLRPAAAMEQTAVSTDIAGVSESNHLQLCVPRPRPPPSFFCLVLNLVFCCCSSLLHSGAAVSVQLQPLEASEFEALLPDTSLVLHGAVLCICLCCSL